MARPTLMRHRKFIKLVAALGSQPLARGVLEMVWDAAYEAGDDRLGSAAELEVIAGWTGERGKLAEAFIACGFVDRVSDDDLRVHDLWHHAPDYVQKRRSRELQRQQRVAPGRKRRTLTAERRTLTGHRPKISAEHSVTLAPAPAPAPAPARAPAQEDQTLSARFARFWLAYPRKVGRGDAERKFAAIKPDDRLLAVMLDAIAWQRKTPQWSKDGGKFIPHPATWLHQRRWEDEPFHGPVLDPLSANDDVWAAVEAQIGGES